MDNKEIKSQLDKIAGSLKNLFKVNNLNENGEPIAVQNSTATAADGTVMYFTKDALAVGVAVFSDEAMSTPIADGTYVVDGSDVSVVAGLVAQIETIEDAKTKMANLETENSTLKAELENLKAENATVKASNETIVNELKTFKNEFENLKRIIPNDVKNLKDLPKGELTPAQKQNLRRKELMNLGK